MYESRIAAGPLTVAAVEGFPPEIDMLAGRNRAGHGFLRAAWFGSDSSAAARTVVLGRGAQGDAIAAIPLTRFGPALAGAQKIAGPYWPFRAIALGPDCSPQELAAVFSSPARRALGNVWRLGPTPKDDPATRILIAAAHAAGWHVLARPAGTSWVIDLDAMRLTGMPRNSVGRKLRAGWRKLEALGTPRWRAIRGAAWNDSVIEDLRRIEADSWIARETDGRSAKFLTADQRAVWRRALADPALAESLTVTILMLDERPIAFNFDLEDGPVRYAIAGSHAEDLKHCSIGKHANYRVLHDCLASNLARFDLGSGDTGYKREMGAVAGYELADLLLVRSPVAAALLARLWGPRLERTARIAGDV
jgi:CelD/BcsL family acetyltransferase involved in cellulose biosynthesis